MKQRNAIIYIVDDDLSVQDALCSLTESISLQTKAYSNVSDFLDNYDRQSPGCLVLDVRMPDINGIDFLESFSDYELTIPTIIISGHGDVRGTVRAMKAGAHDFIEKPFKRGTLIEKIKTCVDIDIQNRQRECIDRDLTNKLKQLTIREQEVLELLVRGYSYKKIAAELGISPRTVEVHRNRCMLKLQLSTTMEMVSIVTAYYSQHDELNLVEKA